MPMSMTVLATRVVPRAAPYPRYRSQTATAEGGRSENAEWARSHAFTPSQREAAANPEGVDRSPT